MAKVRRPRVALGWITRADGVRVEVKNPTIWKLLNEQQAQVQAQQQLLEGLRDAIAKLEAERDRARGEALAVHHAIERSRWGRLGVWLGLIRVPDEVVRVDVREAKAPAPEAQPSALAGEVPA